MKRFSWVEEDVEAAPSQVNHTTYIVRADEVRSLIAVAFLVRPHQLVSLDVEAW